MAENESRFRGWLSPGCYWPLRRFDSHKQSMKRVMFDLPEFLGDSTANCILVQKGCGSNVPKTKNESYYPNQLIFYINVIVFLAFFKVWFAGASPSWRCLGYTTWLGWTISSCVVQRLLSALLGQQSSLVEQTLESVLPAPGVRSMTESTFWRTMIITPKKEQLGSLSRDQI